MSSIPRVEPQPSQSAAPELLAGRFRTLRAIGHGASAALTLATDLESGAQVVIKRAADPQQVRHEADVLAALVHPGIVRLAGRDDTATPPFLVLEPVEGEDLEAVLRRHGGMLDAATLGRLLLQLTEIVAFVHGAGFLHRDLKPGNVLIRPDGSPVIVDFGAALARDQVGSRPWSFVTEGYAAPEQYFADQREGPWTDVYGLGALAYRALSGSAPAAALIRAGGAPGELLARAGARDLGLRRAIDWALDPEAADRPQSIAAWRERLVVALAEVEAETARPVSAAAGGGPGPVLDDYPPTIRVARARAAGRRSIDRPYEPPPKPPRRAPVLLMILAALAVAGAAAAALYGWPLYERYLKTAWRVEQAGGGDTVTIADALARARDGAIITIGPGTYRESLRMERPAHLVALEGAMPIVAPESGPCVLVTSRTGSVAGLGWQPAPSADEGAVACVVLSGGAVTLEGNRIAGEGVGLLIRDGADPVVRGNRLDGVGLVVTAGGRGTITENAIVGVSGASLVVRGGADPSLSDNVIEGGGGVVFAEGAAGSLVGNRLLATDATGIRVTTGAHPRIIDNTIEGAREAGIFVYDGGSGRFEDNTIAASGLSGMVIAGVGRPELVANRIRDNGEHGVLVVEGGSALVEGNEIAGNQGHGIALGAGSEVALSDNRLEGNDEPQLIDAR